MGLGHGVGVLAVALAGRLLGDLVALDRIGAWAELSVGFVLVALGVRALARTLKRVEPAPPDARGPFWIGVLHGAAGAHHLLLVLPALLLDPAGALSYLGAYLVAAVLAMAAAGALLARSLRGRGARAHRVAQGLAGAAALLVGAVWIGASVQLA